MKRKLFALVLVLQCAWIFGTTFVEERALRVGQIVLLETRPVDPRDWLRGDYVILNYKISDVPVNLFSPSLPKAVPDGTAVYVALAAHGQFHEIVRASTEPLTPAAGEVVMRGRSGALRWWGGQTPSAIHVEYGLERFYVHEGTGNPGGQLTVQAAVPASGQATIKQVFVDGKPYAETMKRNRR